MKVGYAKEIEELMQRHYARLPEKERRRYAALEAEKLGRGGPSYLKRLLGVDYKTIQTGKRELLQLTTGELIDCKGQRSPGGGRKKNGSKS